MKAIAIISTGLLLGFLVVHYFIVPQMEPQFDDLLNKLILMGAVK